MLNIFIGTLIVIVVFFLWMALELAFESIAEGIFKVTLFILKRLFLPFRWAYKLIANMITEGNKNDCI